MEFVQGLWLRAERLARLTPYSRNCCVDFLRAASISVVILGHWLVGAEGLALLLNAIWKEGFGGRKARDRSENLAFSAADEDAARRHGSRSLPFTGTPRIPGPPDPTEERRGSFTRTRSRSREKNRGARVGATPSSPIRPDSARGQRCEANASLTGFSNERSDP